jgi:hypothetical protein
LEKVIMSRYLRKTVQVMMVLGLLFGSMLSLGIVQPVEAQTDTPRPTPTTDPETTPTLPPDPTATFTPEPPQPTSPPPGDNGDDADPGTAEDVRGSIQGMVYEDVTGNGRCIGTGVEGEGPVEGIPVEFVSSDGQTIITLTSGPDGQFGLFAAGASYWAVSARPGADWVVTSEQTLYAPVFADNLSVTGVNFCIRQATAAGVILPASGGAHSWIMTWLGLVGLLFIGLGLVRYWYERRLPGH